MPTSLGLERWSTSDSSFPVHLTLLHRHQRLCFGHKINPFLDAFILYTFFFMVKLNTFRSDDWYIYWLTQKYWRTHSGGERMCVPVKLLYPKYQWCHSRDYIFCLDFYLFIGSNYPKNKLSRSWKKLHWWTRVRSWQHQCQMFCNLHLVYSDFSFKLNKLTIHIYMNLI